LKEVQTFGHQTEIFQQKITQNEKTDRCSVAKNGRVQVGYSAVCLILGGSKTKVLEQAYLFFKRF
jgi:hypothetical protein